MAPALRVAVVARAVMPLHGVGGLERSVHDLVRHLASRGVGVVLITAPPGPVRHAGGTDPFAVPHVAIRHVPYRTFPFANRRGTTILDRSTAYPLFGWRAGRLADALVREGRVDIVHGFGASVLGYALARDRWRRRGTASTAGPSSGSAPLVMNPQGLEEFGGTASRWPLLKRMGYFPLRRAVRRSARAADCLIATDEALEPVVMRHLHPAPDQLRTIPNGIDLVAASEGAGPAEGLIARQRHGIQAGETVLLSVGRLEENKGFDVLAAALERAVAAAGPLAAGGWWWVVVGGGSQAHALRHAAVARGLGSRVIFTGRVGEAELHAWYEAATIFVHPTRYEGSSLVTLEAMAHRLPVIASAAGGLPDKVRPGVNGWLVEPGDAEGLARALEEAASDPSRLREMGLQSRAIVEHEFAWRVLVTRQIALYEELLSRRPATAARAEREG